MNKIIGILLFVIIAVSSATIAFAYDPSVVEGNGSDSDIFLAAGEAEDNQALYDSVIEKMNAYEAVSKKTVNQNDPLYFEDLTKAWGEYVDALALYKSDTNATAMKEDLNKSIKAYQDACDLIDDLRNDANDKKTSYDKLINDLTYNGLPYFDIESAYFDFDNLRSVWEEYLVALFAYDNTTTVSYYLTQLNESIDKYQSELVDIQGRYINLTTAASKYQELVDGFNWTDLALKVISGISINASYFKELSDAWDDYVYALFVFNNDTDKFNNLKNSFNTSIKPYLEYINNNTALIMEINKTAEAYLRAQNNILSNIDSNLTEANFTELNETWEKYLAAWAAYDGFHEISTPVGDITKLTTSIENYLALVNKNDLIQNITIARANYLAKQDMFDKLINEYKVDNITENNFTVLRNLLQEYIDAWVKFNATDMSSLMKDLNATIESYLFNVQFNANLTAMNNAKSKYDEELDSIMARYNSGEVLLRADFDNLTKAWDNYLLAKMIVTGSYDDELWNQLNQSIEEYLVDIENGNYDNVKAINAAKIDYDEALDALKDHLKDNLVTDTNHILFVELREAWDVYVKALCDYNDSADYDELIADLDKCIEDYIGLALGAIGYIGNGNPLYGEHKFTINNSNGVNKQDVSLWYENIEDPCVLYKPDGSGQTLDTWGFALTTPDGKETFSFCADIGAHFVNGQYIIDNSNRGFSDAQILYIIAAIDYIFDHFEYPNVSDLYISGKSIVGECYALSQIIVWNALLLTGNEGYSQYWEKYAGHALEKIEGYGDWYNQYSDMIDGILYHTIDVVGIYNQKLANASYTGKYVSAIGFLMGTNHDSSGYFVEDINQQRQLFILIGEHEGKTIFPEFPDADYTSIYPYFEPINDTFEGESRDFNFTPIELDGVEPYELEFEPMIVSVPEPNNHELDFPPVEVDKGYIGPEWVNVDADINTVFIPPFVAPEIIPQEKPFLPHPEEGPEPDTVIEGNEVDDTVSPNVDGNNQPNVDALEDSKVDDKKDVVKSAKASMKNTGLPIGLILALFMSIFVTIRKK